jgi:hypothetical protein
VSYKFNKEALGVETRKDAQGFSFGNRFLR